MAIPMSLRFQLFKERVRGFFARLTWKDYVKFLILIIVVGLFVLFVYKVTTSLYTRPKNVMFTNITSSSTTISWVTEVPSTGEVYYDLKDTFLPWFASSTGHNVANDDRDVNGSLISCLEAENSKIKENLNSDFSIDNSSSACADVKVTKQDKYYVHHITISNLEPQTQYYFRVGDGFWGWNLGKTSFETFAKEETVETPLPLFGKIVDKYSETSNDSIIYLTFNHKGTDSQTYSSVTNQEGGWYIDGSNVKTEAGVLLQMEAKQDTFKAKGIVKNDGISDENSWIFGQFDGAFPDIIVDGSVSLSNSSFFVKGLINNVSAAKAVSGCTKISADCSKDQVSKNCTDKGWGNCNFTNGPVVNEQSLKDLGLCDTDAKCAGNFSSMTGNAVPESSWTKAKKDNAKVEAKAGSLTVTKTCPNQDKPQELGKPCPACPKTESGCPGYEKPTCPNIPGPNTTRPDCPDYVAPDKCNPPVKGCPNYVDPVTKPICPNIPGPNTTRPDCPDYVAPDKCNPPVKGCPNYVDPETKPTITVTPIGYDTSNYMMYKFKVGEKDYTIKSDNPIYTTLAGKNCTPTCEIQTSEIPFTTTVVSACGPLSSPINDPGCNTARDIIKENPFIREQIIQTKANEVKDKLASINKLDSETTYTASEVANLNSTEINAFTYNVDGNNVYSFYDDARKKEKENPGYKYFVLKDNAGYLHIQYIETGSLTAESIALDEILKQTAPGQGSLQYEIKNKFFTPNLINKVYSASEEQSLVYLPEIGLYSIQLGPVSMKNEIVNGGNVVLYYIEANGIAGLQMPADIKNPKAGDDFVIDSTSFKLGLKKLATGAKYTFKAGINLVSFNMYPVSSENKSSFTAKDLISIAKDQKIRVEYVSYFANGRWVDGYKCDIDGVVCTGNDFPILPGRGYLVKTSGEGTVVIPAYTFTKPIPIPLFAGWNLVGVQGYSKSYTADSLLSSINALTTIKADNVTWYPTSKSKYEGLQIVNEMKYGYDFKIDPMVGYFVRVNSITPTDAACKSVIWNEGGELNGRCGDSKTLF